MAFIAPGSFAAPALASVAASTPLMAVFIVVLFALLSARALRFCWCRLSACLVWAIATSVVPSWRPHRGSRRRFRRSSNSSRGHRTHCPRPRRSRRDCTALPRSEEHTSELQSQFHLVCRLLLEKK